METTQSGLRFVEADRLDTSAGRLDDVVVRGLRDAPIGRLRGVMVDPDLLHMRYFVVECRTLFSSADRRRASIAHRR
jgi:hypothetical protein